MEISYFENGIKQTVPNKFISFEDLYELIKNCPHKDFINKLRNLKQSNSPDYKKEKKKLPNITPHLKTDKRKSVDGEFEKNFHSFTQLMYFDIDDVKNIIEVKQRIINEYKDILTLVCISPSGNGISILIRVEFDLTTGNFMQIWNSIRLNEFGDENIDMKSTGIIRAMFISSDPDVYFNPDAYLKIDYDSNKEWGIDHNTCVVCNNNVISPFSDNNIITRDSYTNHNFDKVLKLVKRRTEVDINNPVVEIKEVDFVSTYIPRVIPDGKRHSTFYTLIHHLIYLNPELDISFIYSYIFFINYHFAKPRLDYKDLLRHFNSVVNQIYQTNTLNYNFKIRRIHFNRNCWYLTSKDKETIAKCLNGLIRRKINQRKVFDAIAQLQDECNKITNIAIKEITGLDLKTIRKHRKSPVIDLDKEVMLMNHKYDINNHTPLPDTYKSEGVPTPWLAPYLPSKTSPPL